MIIKDFKAISIGKLLFPEYQVAIRKSEGLFSPARETRVVASIKGWRRV
jgi:hypothetical protein